MSVPEVNTLIAITLVVMNLLGFLAFSVDKLCAKKGWRRISEARLLTIAALFGSAGCLCGIFLFHHKTRKPKFTVTVPLLMILQAGLIFIIQLGL